MHAVTLLALLPLAAVAAPSRRAQPAPLIKPRGGTLVADKYIVRLRNDAGTGAMRTAMAAFAADADHVYSFGGAWRGFSSTLNASEVAALRDDPNVDSVEQDAVVTISATQRNASWGLARLSSAKPGSTTYSYDESAGDGTCAYIVDTGIDVDHPDFEGRASFLANFADDSDTDGQGHGTHVAGTVGSATYGVAKKTKLFAVKVLDDNGEGTNSGVIAGMDFVVSDVRGGREGCSRGVVVNMSLGGPTSAAVNEAAAAIVRAGHFLAVAAGNEAADASTSSPASEGSACTVGATAEDDSLAEYSNFGAVVDILAPGSEIESTWPGGSTDTISGTSMASPHVAGLAAYLLGLGSAPSDPVKLCSYIAETALDGVVSQVPRRTVNKLANNSFAGNGTAKATDGSVVGRQLNTRFAVRS